MFFLRKVIIPQVPSTSTKSTYHILYSRRRFENIRSFMSVADNDENIQGKFVKVATTGYSFTDANGKRVAKYGIFWGKDDPRNGIRTLPEGSTNVAAMLTAILEAINVAREEDPPPSLLIYSDLTTSDTLLRDLSVWAKRDFYSRDHQYKLKNSEILHDIFIAVQGLHLKIVHKPTVTSDHQKNVVTTAIMESINKKIQENDEEKLAEKEKNEGKETYCRTDNPVDSVAKIEIRVGTTLDKTGSIVDTRKRKKENWPEVYVSAKCSNNNGFISAGYCTHWPDGHVAGGKAFRFAPFPVTMFRAELAAIEEALKQAVDAELEYVTIITSSAHFMSGWRSQWTRTFDEHKPFTSKIFYERIRDLSIKLKQIHFRYEEIDASSEIGKELEKKCSQGLSYVLIGKDKSEYELEIDDLVMEKEYRQEGIPVVRLFKTGTSLNAGFVWEDENEEGISCCGTPTVLNRILEEAIDRHESSIIIRSDSETLIKSYEARIEVWRRNGWRNSQHKPIGKAAEWEKTWKLKQKIHVNWEIMDTVDEDDRRQNEKIPAFIK